VRTMAKFSRSLSIIATLGLSAGCGPSTSDSSAIGGAGDPSYEQNLSTSRHRGGRGGASNASAGASNASGGASNASGGASNASGGASNASGGASNASAGASNASAGAPSARGGASNASGGASNASGGASNARGGASNASAGASNAGAGMSSAPLGTSSAAAVAIKLGRAPNFLIGMGNDLNTDHSLDGAYTLGPKLDLHYAYLVAYINADKTWGSWKDWNPNGSFVNVLTDSADAKGVAPMMTLYAMAATGDGNLSGLTNDVFEKGYWSDVKLLFQRLAIFAKPAVVQFEPDFWAYAEQQSHEDPTSLKVNVTQSAPDCADLSNDLVGMGHCLLKLARLYAPKAIVGFHASPWAAGDPNATVAFLKKVGADQADVVFADMLDRDAGCFEAGNDPVCARAGAFYWDETNATSPNFHEYLAWSKAITSGLGRPMIWWQVPFGVPSPTKGGTPYHYRDNRAHYIFSHVQEFVDAGGLGVTFGVGADHQTTPTTDGGQFKDAVTKYIAAPVRLR
jgi:hypothetical protein